MKFFIGAFTLCLASFAFGNELSISPSSQTIHHPIHSRQFNTKHESYNDELLAKRYHFQPKQIIHGYKYPIVVSETDEKLFTSRKACPIQHEAHKKYDVVIVGGGPAGLTAAYYLIKSGKAKSILLLEKEPQLGGLAAGKHLTPKDAYARGGAYFSNVEGISAKIYKEIGTGDYRKKDAIEEPIDSYYWNGKLYTNLWDTKTLARLPADFAVFKYIMQKNDEEKLIPEPPLEQDEATKKLDKYNFRTWVDSMPLQLKRLATQGDKKAQRLLFQLTHDRRIDPHDKMKNVRGLLDLYGRSALGEHAKFISAAAFSTFYYSELEKRYASNQGSRAVIENIIPTLNTSKHFHAILNASVDKIKILKDHRINICYVNQNKHYLVTAKYVVFSAPLFLANKLIDDISSLDKEKYKAINQLDYRNY